MMKISRLIALTFVLILAACAHPPAPLVKPNLDLIGMTPMALDVAKIEVVDSYQPPLTDPHVEHLFPTPPQDGAHQWATSHLIGVGSSGTAIVTIKDASVVAVPLARKTGIFDSFKTQADTRYDARLEVVVTIDKPGQGSVGQASAIVEQSASVLEGISLAEREDIWNRMTQALIRDLNTQIQANLREHLARYVIR